MTERRDSSALAGVKGADSLALTGARPRVARRGYVLLETVVATGMLIVGLSIIGSQVQSADKSIKMMERKIRAVALAEQHLAELDMGLVELDSVDEEQEGDFGPRYPDFGWILTTENTALEAMFLLKVDILHHPREGDYREDEFEHELAETVFTVYAMRTAPQPVNFGEDFGLNEEELVDLTDRLAELAIPGLDPESFDPALLGKVDFEELIEALPVLMDAFGIDVSQLMAGLPPNLLEQLQESGFFGDDDESGTEGEEGS